LPGCANASTTPSSKNHGRTFAIVGAALIVVAAIACVIPAWRAARIDALTALRR
jgi:ABC-type lipoprotein release transport system permease subunit